MSARLFPAVLALAAALATAAPVAAAPKASRPPKATKAAKVEKPATATTAATAPRVGGAGLPSLPGRRPIVLDALRVEGRTDAPRVLFVHAGPTVALEDAPAHPSYLRDDFTAALSSPVRVRVRAGEAARPSTAGGNR